MNSSKSRPILPWILFALALLGCIALGFFLLISLTLSVVSPVDDKYPTHGNVAVVEVEGIIKGSRDIVRTLSKLEKKKSVKAIILRVNSPGGAVAPSQEIYEKVKDVASKKVIIASMGAVAASGGYYVSAPARKIVANPGTVTGSIGVVMQLFITKDLLKKLYLDWRVIKSGKVKDMGSPLRDLTPEEVEILKGLSDNIHMQFKKAVADSRKIPAEKMSKLADGRVFTGEQARSLGLVDELGGLEKAVDMAADMAKIEGEPKVFYPQHKRKKFWEYLAESISKEFFGKIEEGFSYKPLYLYGR